VLMPVRQHGLGGAEGRPTVELDLDVRARRSCFEFGTRYFS
jgi:hypothetical protein